MIIRGVSDTLNAVSLTLTLLFGALAFVGVVAAAAVVVSSSRTKQNLELLRGEVSDLTAAKARLEGERDELRTHSEDLKAENKVLRDLATSRPDVEALITEIRGMVATIENGYKGLSQTVVEHGHAQSAN